MNTKTYTSLAIGMAMVAGITATLPAFADTNTNGAPPAPTPGGWIEHQGHGMRGNRGSMMQPGIFGTVSAINGTTLTVAAQQRLGSTTSAISFTVDASNAKVTKGTTTVTVSTIVVGDSVAIQGAITGTNVVATSIRDGVQKPGVDAKGESKNATSTLAFQGNGQPIVLGTVSAVNGSTLSITNKSNVTYTIDTTNAKILKGKETITLSKIGVGDEVLVQGTVNGSSITASTILDQTPSSSSDKAGAQKQGGFFGSISHFFARLFGF